MQDQRKAASPSGEMSSLKAPENEHVDTKQTRQKCFANKIDFFIIHLFLLNLARMALKLYLAGTIRTIERRFGFRSATTSYIFSLTDFAHIALVLFLGHLGRTGHKPRMIGITVIFPALAGLLMAAPYFILPSPSPLEYSTKNSSVVKAQMCVPDAAAEDEVCDNIAIDHNTQNNIAVAFFFVGSLLAGIGGPGTVTLGFPYIDENAGQSRTAVGVGLVVASYSLGPVLGLLLASACTRLPESLIATDMEPTDPNFIGAWWLGFGLGGILVLLLAIPMLFSYPKNSAPQSAAMAGGLQRESKRRRQKNALCFRLKAFLQSLGRLVRDKAYMSLVVSDLLGVFGVVGIFVNLPRYMETHFLMPAYQANMIGAFSSAGMAFVGSLLGGTILSKIKLRVLRIAKLLLICSGSAVLLALLVLFIRCPKLDLDGEYDEGSRGFSLSTTCNRNCSCLANRKTYMPVCGASDVTYFSPCHAGCSTSSNGSFHDCGCSDEGTTTAGLCLGTCNLYLPFAVGLGLVSLVGGIGQLAQAIGIMRVVPEHDRPLALGLNSFAVNLFGLLPSPIFFGYMIDSACDLWQNICGKSGNCLFYDTDKFRWRVYGTGTAFVFGDFLFLVLFFCLVRRNKHRGETTGDDMNMDKLVQQMNCEGDHDDETT